MTKPRLNQLFIWKGFIYLATEQDRPQRRSLCALRSYAADYNSRCGSSLILMLWRLAFYRLGPDDIVVYDGDARGAAVVARGGARYSFELAVEYAEEMSGGRTANYTHYIADENGNWMYLYGNMYYVELVEQYLP